MEPTRRGNARFRPTNKAYSFHVVPLKRRLSIEQVACRSNDALRVAANIAKLPELFQP